MARESAEKFEFKDGARGEQPLIIGLMGPPGGGKTYSGLRIATGVARVRGGPIVVIDTDNDRALKYADDFTFKHLALRPPFRSARFRGAVIAAKALNPSAIMIDCMSDEHEGEGGILDFKEAEIDRFLGDDKDNWSKREAQNRRGWIRPKAERQAMISAFTQMTPKVPLILCFRSRQKTDQRKNDKGKTEIINIGWQPIAPAEIVNNCDVIALLRPRADGKPTWKSSINEEDFVLKLPTYAKAIFNTEGALNEDQGEALARWARGGNIERLQLQMSADIRDLQSKMEGMQRESDKPRDELAARVERAIATMRDQPTEAKLDKAWGLTAALQSECGNAKRDDLIGALSSAYDARRVELERTA